MLSLGYIKRAIQRGMDNYHAKYIETSSPDPIFHVCYGGMILSYLVALPHERRHLEHRLHAQQHHWFIIPSGTFLMPRPLFYFWAVR